MRVLAQDNERKLEISFKTCTKNGKERIKPEAENIKKRVCFYFEMPLYKRKESKCGVVSFNNIGQDVKKELTQKD